MGFTGRLNTAFIERAPLTVRHGVAALARRTWATAQQSPHLLANLEWWRAYYHGCRVLTKHYAWRSCSHESEVANGRRNATGNVRKLWQLAEPTVDGQHVRCSLAPCRRFPLERLTSQMGVLYYVAGRWMKVPAAKLVWSLTPGREGLSGLPHHKKPAQSGLTEGWVIYPPYRMGVPAVRGG